MRDLPLLYTYRRCPYAMRARMALLQAGIAFDAYEIVLRDKPAAMLAASPKGTVLVLPDGRIIEESLDIMRWAFPDTADTQDNQMLIALNDGPFKQQLDRYKYPGRFENADPVENRDQAVNGLLNLLEQRLALQPYLGGDKSCTADIAIFPFIRQFRAVDPIWFDAQPLRGTQRWLQDWLESDLFKACMKKLPNNSVARF
jgi:glutathione S-transferase